MRFISESSFYLFIQQHKGQEADYNMHTYTDSVSRNVAQSVRFSFSFHLAYTFETMRSIYGILRL